MCCNEDYDCRGYLCCCFGQFWEYLGSVFWQIRQLSSRNATRRAKKQRKFSRMVVETKELYTGIHYNLFFATGLALLNAVLYGNVLTIGVLIDVNIIFDFNCRLVPSLYDSDTGNRTSTYEPVLVERLGSEVDFEDQFRNFREFYFEFTIYFILGQVAGASVSNLFYYYLGPKKCLIGANILFLFGWLITLDNNLIMETLLCARFFHGLTSSIVAIQLFIYLYQITTPEYRGLLLGLHCLCTLVGMLMPQLCYYFITPKRFHYVFYQMFIGLVDVLAASVMLMLPETPLFLLGQYNDPKELFNAEQSLQHLRSRKNPSATLIEVNRLVGEKDLSSTIKLYHPLFLKPLFCSMLLVLVQECCLFSSYFIYGQPLPFMFFYLSSNHSAIQGHFAATAKRPTTAMLDSWFTLTIGAFQITSAVLVVGILVRKYERRTILVLTAIVVIVLNILQGVMLEHYEQKVHPEIVLHRRSLNNYNYQNYQHQLQMAVSSTKSNLSINNLDLAHSRSHIPGNQSANLRSTVHIWPVHFPFLAMDICTVISSICDISIRIMVWILIVEMPIHEYRVYNTLCCWIFALLLTFGQLLYAHALPHKGYILYYLSSILLIPTVLTLYIMLPNTNNLTTNQIIPQFL